jgi:hypothetical protein
MKKILDTLFYWGLFGGRIPSFMVFMIVGIIAVSVLANFGYADGTMFDAGFWVGTSFVFLSIVSLVYLMVRTK